METAKPITDVVLVLSFDRIPAKAVLPVARHVPDHYSARVGCPDADAFETLPPAIEYQGRILAKSGWNSDYGVAYYRTDWALRLARPLAA